MARPQEFNTTEALHQAMRVFWRKGYEATSLADLLDATGLSKSSLYGTFGGKRELFLAAFDAYREERIRDMHRILDNGPARPAIEKFFEMIVGDVLAENPKGCMSINQAVEMAPHDVAVRQRVASDFQSIEDALVRTIERGRNDGTVKSMRSTRDLAKLLVLGFPGLQVMVRSGGTKTWLEDGLTALLTSLD